MLTRRKLQAENRQLLAQLEAAKRDGYESRQSLRRRIALLSLELHELKRAHAQLRAEYEALLGAKESAQ